VYFPRYEIQISHAVPSAAVQATQLQSSGWPGLDVLLFCSGQSYLAR